MNAQFKIDENLPVEIAELFVNAGHDAKTVNEQQLKGTKDPVLIAVCKSEHRVLVTLDTDFSDIRAYPPQEFAGILAAMAFAAEVLKGDVVYPTAGAVA